MVAGLQAEVHLHCCHSVYKRRSDVTGDYKPILPRLADACVDRVNLEFAYPGTGDVSDLKLLPAHLAVGMGVVDVRSEAVPSVEQIEALGAAGAALVGPGRMALNPDCGFAPDAGEPPFCNWLSKQEGLPRAERCYPDLEEFDYGMVLPADYLERQGYRLPTEAEWEYTCRAGATTSRFYGTAEEMLKEYAWYSKTANKRTFPVGQLKPNDLGLFDVLGNAMEWCQDVGDDYRVTPGEVRIDLPDTALQVTKAQPRVLRGGSFFYLGRSVRSAFRDYYRPDFPLMYVGLRVARTMPSR